MRSQPPRLFVEFRAVPDPHRLGEVGRPVLIELHNISFVGIGSMEQDGIPDRDPQAKVQQVKPRKIECTFINLFNGSMIAVDEPYEDVKRTILEACERGYE